MFQPRLDKPAPARSTVNFSRDLPNPWWVSFIIITGACLMGAGALIALLKPAMLVAPGDAINGAVGVYAGYLVSRNLSLAVMLIATLKMRAWAGLNTLMLLTALIQLLDAGMDALEGRWALIPGVLVFAIAFFAAATRISRSDSGTTW